MDIEQLIEEEHPDALKIKELIEERVKINRFKAELEERRKDVDTQLSEFCNENKLDKIKSGNHTLAIVSSKGSGRWNKNELVRMLSPLQLEKVYSEGKGYSYVKVTSKHANES